MSKRYHCDYCNKILLAVPSVIKIHNKGLVHQKLVKEHYQRLKDPATIIKEESTKSPCSRYRGGTCQFGYLCRFSHYTREEIEELKHIVASSKVKLEDQLTTTSLQDIYQKLEQKKPDLNQTESMILNDPQSGTFVLPWPECDIHEKYQNLPPSIQQYKMEDILNSNLNEWG